MMLNRTRLTWGSAALALLLAPALVLHGCDGGKQNGAAPKMKSGAKALGGASGSRTVVLANGLEAVEGELLVRFKDEAGMASAARVSALGGAVLHSYRSISGLHLVRIPADQTIENAVAAFQASPDVLYAEPNYTFHLGATPDDARFDELWGMNNTGQTGGTADADINAPEAWDITTGSDQAIVAVIDTGLNYAHEDLAANAWVNPGEIPDNDVDDDGNGYVDDVHGINAITNTGDPMDDHGHGSHCSGTIAGHGNNGLGVAGVNWTARVLGCKFLSSSGSGSAANAIKCLDYIHDLKTRPSNPVDIAATSNSWGGGSFSQALLDGIAQNLEAGILFVAAAGNSNVNNDTSTSPHYPSSYYLPNVIAVAATDHSDAKASFSSYGRRRVHVGAPGVDILSSTLGENTYATMSGTSMATPHTTGLVALLKAQDPSRDWKALRNLVLSGGTDVPSMNGITVTGKRIRAADVGGVGSLTCLDRVVTSRLLPIPSDIQVLSGAVVDIAALNINCAAPNGDVVLAITPGANVVTLRDDGQGIDQVAGDGVYSAQWSPPAAGTFTLTFPDGDAITVTALDVYRPALTPTPEYRDITATGTALNIAENTIVAVPTPFPIQYANHLGFDTAFISSEGYLSFNTNLSRTSNYNIPYTSFQTLVAPFWESLRSTTSPPGNVYHEVLGSAPDREWVIEWRGVSYSSTTIPADATITFQVVFKEGSSDVQFNYLDVHFMDGTSTYDRGGSATVGVQVNSTNASRFSYNTKSLNDGMSLLFKTNAPPSLNALAASPTSVDEGGSSISFSSTFTDADGAADADWTAEWDFDYVGTTFTVDDSQTFSIEGPISIDHTFLQSGRFVVGLRIKDKDGGPSAVRTIVVDVNNIAPVAVAPTIEPAAPIEGEAVTFSASFSDVVDGDNPWKAEWDFEYDGVTFHAQKTQSYSSQGNVSVTNTYMEDGTYTVALRVLDKDGGLSAIVTSTVVIADVSPTITATYASPDNGTEPTTVEFNATAQSGSPTPEADPVRYYLWDFDGDGNPDHVSPDPRAVHRYLDNPAGGDTYTVKVWVEDEDSSSEQVISVVVANMPPVLAEVPAEHSAREGDVFEYQLVATDPGGRNDPLSYRLTTAPAGMTVSSAGLIHWVPSFAQSGLGTGSPHPVTVEVSDDDGAVVTASLTVTALRQDLDNDPPTIPVAISPADGTTTSDATPTLVVLNAKDEEGEAITYEFELRKDKADGTVVAATDDVSEGESGTRFTVDTKLENGKYYWRARARDASGGTSDWTEPAMFNVNAGGGCGCAATTAGGLMGNLFPMALIPLGLALLRRRRR